MGVSSSTLKKLVSAEFHRLAKGRAYITLDEVLEFRLQSGGWDISTDCIGVLFSIDRDRDGTFQLSELRKFATDWNFLGSNTPHHELESVVHSLCMAQFWRHIITDEGLSQASQWLVALGTQNYVPINHVAEPTEVETVPLSALTPESANLPMALSGMVEHGDSQDYSPRMFDKYPGILYVHQQNLPGLYRILCHQGAHKHDMMSFTNTLQRDAEERGMMDIQDKELDDWVPEPVIKDYVVEVLQNCRQLVEEMDALRYVTRSDGSRRRQTVLEEAHDDLSSSIGNMSVADSAR